MSAVFPTGLKPDSEFLYERMREATYDALAAEPGDRILDAAAGLGNDAQRLAERGLCIATAEPSRRITELAKLIARERDWKDYGSQITPVRAWSEVLPFPDRTFRGSFCKGSLDHFDDPEAAIAELARVTRAGGRIVLSVVNMDSLGCRAMAWRDRFGRRRGRPERRHYDAPPDHYTRYDPGVLREQTSRHCEIEQWTGVSLLWGIGWWASLLAWMSERNAARLLRLADRLARRFPGLADVIVVAGPPR